MSGDKFRISQCDVEKKKKCNPSSENSTTEQCYCWLNGGDHLDLPERGAGGSVCSVQMLLLLVVRACK